MQIYKNISDLPKDKNTVVTVGTFDGVHLGHQNIFEKLKLSADENGYRSVIITFDPHPRTVVSNDFNLKLLTTFDEKIDVLYDFDIDSLVIINFTEEFAKLDSEEFIKDYLVDGIAIKEFVIGHDHKFGKNRDGGENTLKLLGDKYGFDVLPVAPVQIEDEIISSTKIRNLLLDGELILANKMLGRNYFFDGIIVSGATRGRILGFPTANINISDEYKLIPKTGVYAVECLLEKEIVYGVMNIGFRPTFEEHGSLVIEVHLFDFNREVYGQKISVKLLNRLRDEIKFSSKEELVYQIERDKRKAIQIIGSLIN